MLEQSLIKKIVHCQLPDEEIRQHLLTLDPLTLDVATFNHFVMAAKETADPVDMETLSKMENVFDCCGTGGSGKTHYNVSTMAAFILAAGGVRVAKFGNRSSKQATGSFDFLEALDIPITLAPAHAVELLEATNLVFLFAPQYYPALAKLKNVRKSIDGSTVFNYLGPLLNPTNPQLRILGTFEPNVQRLLTEYLAKSNIRRGWVVRSANGLDELDPFGVNYVEDVQAGEISQSVLATFVQSNNQISASHDQSALDNARLFKDLLEDPDKHPYVRDLVCFNAGAGFVITGTSTSLEEGFANARNILSSDKVKKKLDQVRRLCATSYSR